MTMNTNFLGLNSRNLINCSTTLISTSLNLNNSTLTQQQIPNNRWALFGSLPLPSSISTCLTRQDLFFPNSKNSLKEYAVRYNHPNHNTPNETNEDPLCQNDVTNYFKILKIINNN